MSGPRKVGDLTDNLEQTRGLAPVANHLPPKAVAIDPQTRSVIDELFEQLKANFTAWRQAWPTDAELGNAKRLWLAEFMRSGIRSLDQIQHGLRVAAKQREPWVPTPGVFVDWCFAPDAFGLPPVERAYRQAMHHTHPSQAGQVRWSHPAIYHAAVACGYLHLQRLARREGMALFEAKYLEQCRRIGRGEVLPPAPIAELPAPVTKGSPEVAADALASIRQRLGRCRG